MYIQMHPRLGTALQAFKCEFPPLLASPHLSAAFERHAASAQLTWLEQRDDGHHVPQARPDDDGRVLALIRTTSRRQTPRPGIFPTRSFIVDSGAGMHCLRQICRYRAVSRCSRQRYDAEGLDNIDLEANNSRQWKAWTDSLSPMNSSLLRVFRGGAVSSPTRRSNFCPSDACPSCGAPRASMRHFIVHCNRYSMRRQQVQDLSQLPDGWLTELPRVTTKSGWITCAASPCSETRATLQVAVCMMAIEVMEDRGRP